MDEHLTDDLHVTRTLPSSGGPWAPRYLAPPLLALGDIRIWPVIDGKLIYGGGAAGIPGSESPEFSIHRRYIDDGALFMDIGGFVVQSGDDVVLIDAGAGQGGGPTVAPKQSPGFPSELRTGLFGSSLRLLGFDPSDITHVFLSHLHFDHVGWLTRSGRPYFPNAQVRCERHDADFFLGSTYDDRGFAAEWGLVSVAHQIEILGDRFDTWDEETTLIPGLVALFTPGHTPGSCAFSLSGGGEQALILGDIVHCAHELCDANYNVTYRSYGDVDFEQAETARARVRGIAVNTNALVSSPHFPGLEFGRLRLSSERHVWQFEWSR